MRTLMTMKLALFSALVLALATPAVVNAQNLRNGNWDYITTAEDETSYFGQILSRMGNQVVLKVLVVNGKDEADKDYVVTRGVKCKEKMLKAKRSQWKKVAEDVVGWSWIQFACQ